MIKNYKKITITAGIPVFNEASNITSLINSILEQDNKYCSLEKIIIVIDGSTDGTSEIIEHLSRNNPKISFVSHKSRKGKAARLEEIYDINQSDLIVTFDGDIILGNKQVLDNMTLNFCDERTVVVGANALPLEASNIIEKLINTWLNCWYQTRKDYKNGHNIFNVLSCSLALRKDFAKKITFPTGIVSDGQFIYLSAVMRNLKFRFAENATVCYRSEDNIFDYLKRLHRVSNDRKIQTNKFGDKIKIEYEIPYTKKLKGIITVFKKEPFLTLGSVLFHYIMLYIPSTKQVNRSNPGIWEIINSTKKPLLQNINYKNALKGD